MEIWHFKLHRRYVRKPESKNIKNLTSCHKLKNHHESVCYKCQNKRPVKNSLCHLKKSALNRRAVDSLFWRTKKSVGQYFFYVQVSLCKVQWLLRNTRDRFIRVPASNVSNNHGCQSSRVKRKSSLESRHSSRITQEKPRSRARFRMIGRNEVNREENSVFFLMLKQVTAIGLI
ncbi:hypothetical protein TorRG33x02_198410 [Trema orientale]|uniref:Uncharacterized protein n=1 Tax=Trema orientale TaxID=63057 RepID=A0A2P5EFR2_TREOI|nr:hypothetical protein TorRG33x02_198410 [Trema orientale]